MNFSKNGKISGNNNKSKSNLRPTLIVNQTEIKKEEMTIIEDEIIVIDKDKTDTEFWEDCDIENVKKNENQTKNKNVEKSTSEEYLTCKIS